MPIISIKSKTLDKLDALRLDEDETYDMIIKRIAGTALWLRDIPHPSEREEEEDAK